MIKVKEKIKLERIINKNLKIDLECLKKEIGKYEAINKNFK